MQHFLVLTPPDGARSNKSILVAYICIVMTNAVSLWYKPGHLNPQMLVFSAFEDCRVVVFLINPVVASMCATHTILWFETSPSIHILNFCRDVLRSCKHNLRQFLLQFQPGWSWYGQPFDWNHLKCLLNLFCIKWILMVIWKHQSWPLGKTVVTPEINLSVCWLQ